MMHISLCVTLLTLIAAMYLLAKTKKESLGSFFKWVSYAVIVITILMFVAEFVHGMMRMGHRRMHKEVRIEMNDSAHHKMMMMKDGDDDDDMEDNEEMHGMRGYGNHHGSCCCGGYMNMCRDEKMGHGDKMGDCCEGSESDSASKEMHHKK